MPITAWCNALAEVPTSNMSYNDTVIHSQMTMSNRLVTFLKISFPGIDYWYSKKGHYKDLQYGKEDNIYLKKE